MFVHNVTLELKPEALLDFIQAIINDVLPMLRKQNGFREQLICISADRTAAQMLCFWESKEYFDAYTRMAGPDILKLLSKITHLSLHEENLELYLSTIHQLAKVETISRAGTP